MDLKVWKQISKDYEIAKICLWCPDKIKIGTEMKIKVFTICGKLIIRH